MNNITPDDSVLWKDMVNPNKTIVSTKRLLNYIRRNPGLTTCQLTLLLRRKTITHYTASAFSQRLYILTQKGKVYRILRNAANSDGFHQAWRHYSPLIAKKILKEYPDAIWQFGGKSNHPAYKHNETGYHIKPGRES